MMASRPSVAGPRAAATLRWDCLLIVVIGLVVNTLVAVGVNQPGYMDAAYYFGGAVTLGRGQGFSEPYLWNYLRPFEAEAAAARQWPSHLYWMPLASLVSAPAVAAADALLGRPLSNAASFRAAQAPMVLLGALLPLLSYAAAQRLTGVRRHAWAAALLTLLSPYYLIYWPTTESFALYGLTAAGALLAADQAARVAGGKGGWLFAAGALAGLAHLTRADGLLVVLVIGLWWAWAQRRAAGLITTLAILAAGYLVVMGPWFIRNLMTVGAPLAPGGLRAAWLVTYADLFTLTPEQLTVVHYFASGWGDILAGKWAALVTNGTSLLAVQMNIFGLPLLLAGAWRLRHNPLVQLTGLYALALFTAMTLVFTFPGERGGFFHSSVALLPVGWAVMLAGLDAGVEAIARRLKHWRPERSKPLFSALLVAVSALLAVAFTAPRWATWPARGTVYAEAGAAVAALDSAPLVMVNDPPSWHYQTNQPAINLPTGDRAVLLSAMRQYGAHWLVIDANHAPALEPFYAGLADDPDLRLRASFGPADAPTYLLELTGQP